MKKIIIVLAVILLGGYFAYPGIQGKMNEARLKRENSNAEIIGGADDSGVLYPKVDPDAEFTFQASDFLSAKNFIFESSSVKSDLEKDYDNAARAFGFGSES